MLSDMDATLFNHVKDININYKVIKVNYNANQFELITIQLKYKLTWLNARRTSRPFWTRPPLLGRSSCLWKRNRWNWKWRFQMLKRGCQRLKMLHWKMPGTLQRSVIILELISVNIKYNISKIIIHYTN